MAYDGINLDYGKIVDVTNVMKNAHDQIVPLVENLRTRVNTLVEDGLVFKQSSEVIRNTYNNFDTSLKAAVKGIEDFREMFNSIKKNAEDFDQGISNSLNQAK
ncbi:hypothetical protein HPO96_32090 [Kribbella sandramycini]|uniref:WXG100 family type VII secretion target n=1 Tax=Kribbella sandramycini TaxID=60450 RepID=A0A7Y4L5S6_9ACTN|nr:hypothetical protein [Kribbella sandramycini]MBB6565897.1 hypothetical protein [Kribbella sandramycini]NOL44903.1 hypothetical protein [Kribbella sandramycini]